MNHVVALLLLVDLVVLLAWQRDATEAQFVLTVHVRGDFTHRRERFDARRVFPHNGARHAGLGRRRACSQHLSEPLGGWHAKNAVKNCVDVCKLQSARLISTTKKRIEETERQPVVATAAFDDEGADDG